MKRATVVSGLVVVLGARVWLRVRPILMTALATILRMIPPARAVTGGLSVSTFLTLFLIPVLFLMMFLIPTLYLWLDRGGYRYQEALDEGR